MLSSPEPQVHYILQQDSLLCEVRLTKVSAHRDTGPMTLAVHAEKQSLEGNTDS